MTAPRLHAVPAIDCSAGAMTVNDAVAFSAFGRTVLYKAMSSGALAYIQVGKRRKIPKQNLVAWMEAQG